MQFQGISLNSILLYKGFHYYDKGNFIEFDVIKGKGNFIEFNVIKGNGKSIDDITWNSIHHAI